MVKTQDFIEDVALILESGFVAIKYGDRETALNCFHAAALLAPDRVEPKVGLATLALNELDLDKAISLCKEVLETDKENHQAMVICGMSMILLHKEEETAHKLLTTARENATDDATKQLAELWLGYITLSHKPAQPMNPEAKKRISKEIASS
jgi:Flp pilus assembly protein TadD